MEKILEIKSIANTIAELTRSEYIEDGDKILIKLRRVEKSIEIDCNQMQKLIAKISSKSVEDQTKFFDDNEFEVLVKEEAPLHIRRFRDEKYILKDSESQIEYEISPPSEEYIVWLLTQMSEYFSPKELGFTAFYSPRIEKLIEESKGVFSIFDYLRYTLFRFPTLKIRSVQKSSYRQFIRLTNSFLFQLGYNIDAAFVPVNSLDNIYRRVRLSKIRRSKIDEIDPPRRAYNEDLIHHYLLAVSTDNVVVEYLSYYHILEHFFESVFSDELIETTRSILTHPSFSYKRKKDISLLIKSVRKSLQIRSETISFSESEALRLCLIKFVNLAELFNELKAYDESLISYYKNNEVAFSNGDKFDLENTDQEQTLKQLTKRIYQTRNALVHSKENELSKYKPFVDEEVLSMELPLMRFVAEMVIIKESTLV